MKNIIFVIIDRYFQAGGSHEEMVKLLSENYTGIAQSTNLLANWLIVTGKLHVMSIRLGIYNQWIELN